MFLLVYFNVCLVDIRVHWSTSSLLICHYWVLKFLFICLILSNSHHVEHALCSQWLVTTCQELPSYTLSWLFAFRSLTCRCFALGASKLSGSYYIDLNLLLGKSSLILAHESLVLGASVVDIRCWPNLVVGDIVGLRIILSPQIPSLPYCCWLGAVIATSCWSSTTLSAIIFH